MLPRYIYPPRPKSTIPPQQLSQEESRGCWMWQHKFNGDRCPIVIDVKASGRNVYLCNRKGRFLPDQKYQKLRKELCSQNLSLPVGVHYLDAELLPEIETVVLFDVLQLSKYLIGVSQEKRLSMLKEICRNPIEPCQSNIALLVTEHIWMSRHGDKDFVGHFEEYIESTMIEGLVLRKKESTLDNWGSSEYEVDWQLRCRKNSSAYRY
jgi:hypothetical protein